MSPLVELQLVSLIWACKYSAKLWAYHSWRRWWARYLGSDSRLDPWTLCEKWDQLLFVPFVFFCFFFKHALLRRMEKPANAQNDGPLHGSTRIILGVKPIIASRSQLWPRVWFMFSVNWKQWRGARLPPVCARWAAAGWVFSPSGANVPLFVLGVFSPPQAERNVGE